VLSIVPSYGKCPRTLTYENLLPRLQGDPGNGGWSFPLRPSENPEEEAARVVARLYEGLRDAGPLLKKCCPEPPVQGLLFDYRNVPTRGVGDLQIVAALRDGSMIGVSGHTVSSGVGVGVWVWVCLCVGGYSVGCVWVYSVGWDLTLCCMHALVRLAMGSRSCNARHGIGFICTCMYVYLCVCVCVCVGGWVGK
jgi:hypothetical protein